MPHDNNETQVFNTGTPAGFNETSHRTAAVQVHGKGRTVVSYGIPAEVMSAPAPELTRVHTGAIRMTMNGDGEVTSLGPARHVHTDTGTPGGSVMGTLRTTGSSASVELVPGDPTTRTILATAVREGLIRKAAGGGYEDVGATGSAPVDPLKQASDELAAANQPAPEEQGDPSMGAMSVEDEEDWAADIADMRQPSYDRAAASAVGFIAHGTGSVEGIADSLARDEAIDPALAREYVAEGIAMVQRIVDRAMGSMGLHGEELQSFYAAVRDQPAKLQDAIQRVAHGRDLGGFKALAATWKAANTDLSPWKRAGFQAAVDPQTGDVLVQHGQGRWIKASDLGRA